MQHGQEQEGHGLRDVNQAPERVIAEDLIRRAQVLRDDRRLGEALQHVPPVREHHRVVIDVDHPGLGFNPQRHLVRVPGRRQPGTHIHDLVKAGFRDQVPDDPSQECAVRLHVCQQVRQLGLHGLADLPVGRIIILATEQVIVNARRTGYIRPEGISPGFVSGHHIAPQLGRYSTSKPEPAPEASCGSTTLRT
jgi:hypothetical protein